MRYVRYTRYTGNARYKRHWWCDDWAGFFCYAHNHSRLEFLVDRVGIPGEFPGNRGRQRQASERARSEQPASSRARLLSRARLHRIGHVTICPPRARRHCTAHRLQDVSPPRLPPPACDSKPGLGRVGPTGGVGAAHLPTPRGSHGTIGHSESWSPSTESSHTGNASLG